MSVQALGAELAIETFDVAVVGRDVPQSAALQKAHRNSRLLTSEKIDDFLLRLVSYCISLAPTCTSG